MCEQARSWYLCSTGSAHAIPAISLSMILFDEELIGRIMTEIVRGHPIAKSVLLAAELYIVHSGASNSHRCIANAIYYL